MKRLLAITAAAAVMAMAGTAMAATANLEVTAEVVGVCTMTGGTLDFGELNPTAPSNVTRNSSGVTVTCTYGTDYALSGDDGSHASGTQKRLNNGGTTANDFIAYSVTIPTGGTGTGSAVPVTIAGNIASGAYATARAGTYSDTIELTVTP